MRALEIFWLCFRTSLISFAGVYGAMPEYSRLFADERNWVSPEQLVQDYVVAQAMPGPNMVLAVMIGFRAAGMVGAVSAFLGTYTPPMLVMTLAMALLDRYRRLVWVRRAELAVRPVVVGLMFGAVATILRQQAVGHGMLLTAVVGLTAAFVNKRWVVSPLLLLLGTGLLFGLLGSFAAR